MLEVGTYAVEWFSVNDRQAMKAGKLNVVTHADTTFVAPFAKAGPSVLYLKSFI